MKKSIRAFLFRLCAAVIITGIVSSVLPVFPARSAEDSGFINPQYENISIGAGGTFYFPYINPTDSSQYVVVSDMGGVYSTVDAGDHWNRNNTSFMNATCMTEDGIYFAGGYGLYISYDNGKTLEMIYPREETVQYTVNLNGRDNPLMIADGYENNFLIAVNTYGKHVYFLEMDWNGTGIVRLCRCLFDGAEFENLYSFSGSETSPMRAAYDLEITDNDVIFSDGANIWSYGISSSTLSRLYTARGNIADFERIDEYYFILDNTQSGTSVIYTPDFSEFHDLNEYNSLPTAFRWGNVDRSFEWHYSRISGNHFNNIWLGFYSPVEGISDIGGVLKFDGNAFSWAFDQVYTPWATGETTLSIGWTSGGVAPIFGVCADPNDDNHCIMTNDVTVFDIYYDANTQERKVGTLHCIDHKNGYYQTTGLDCQTTYFVREDPFDSDHIIICSTDIGLQISYDNGISFRRHEDIPGAIDNTCYDLYFDEQKQGLVYGLWSSLHDAPYDPQRSDINAQGGFAVSYDGGITWSFDYSTGIPENSVPVRMSVVPHGDELMIGVATFNNGFYISYDTGKTFAAINDGMTSYDDMIWGEDIAITDDYIYCLTASYNFTGLVPSALYQYDRETAELTAIDMGDIVLANSMTYDKRYGLFVSVTPYYRREWIDEIGGSFWVNYGGGVYELHETHLDLIFETDTGAYNTAFTSDGKMYIADVYGVLYVRADNDFYVYADGLFRRLKNISISRDENTLYVTTLGGGTYRMKTHDKT